MSVVFRRFTIDTGVIFDNKEDESVMEGGVINFTNYLCKSWSRSVPRQRRFFRVDKGWYF